MHAIQHLPIHINGERPILSDKKLYNLKEEDEWILILKKITGQDRQDNAAFGRKAPRRRRKKLLIILLILSI